MTKTKQTKTRTFANVELAAVRGGDAVAFGASGVTGGLATPGCINWLVASSRDANLFS